MGSEPSLRLPRELHPAAWWAWALGMATAASRTTNPFLLAEIIAVLAFVVSARRGDSPWSRGFRAYLVTAMVVIGIRVVFRALLDASSGGHILFTLPEVPLPESAADIAIGGPVSLEGLLAAVYDGLRLATLLLCVGAANVLANAKRLLKSTPAALHEVGVAIVVALSVAPQLVESAQRVHRARRLRSGSRKGAHVLRQVVIPVMTDALDRSLLLAAAMDSRGFGRTARLRGTAARRTGGALLLFGLVGTCVGVYGLLDGSAPAGLGLPAVALGTAAAAAGVVLGGRQVSTTRYRPDPWLLPEWLVSASGVIVAVLFLVAADVDPAKLNPSLQPLRWPTLPLLPAVAVLIGALPAWLAPPVTDPTRRPEPTDRPQPVAREVAA